MVEFFFGNRFLYCDFYRDNESLNKWYIKKQYVDVKSEIMNNKVYNMELDQYEETYQKAMDIYRASSVVRSMRSIENYCYGIKEGTPLDIPHIMAIIFYTDYDVLSYNFSKTSETDESLKERNSEYWNWGKLITETVEC